MTGNQLNKQGEDKMETTYLLKTKFLTKAGKERTYTFKDVAPELGIELLDEGMCQLAELTKLSEDPTEKVVAPLTVALLQQNTQEMVDHSQDGTMLERRRFKVMEELFTNYCQDHHLSQRHLNDQQIEAICDQLMPYVLLKYPEPRQRR